MGLSQTFKCVFQCSHSETPVVKSQTTFQGEVHSRAVFLTT